MKDEEKRKYKEWVKVIPIYKEIYLKLLKECEKQKIKIANEKIRLFKREFYKNDLDVNYLDRLWEYMNGDVEYIYLSLFM